MRDRVLHEKLDAIKDSIENPLMIAAQFERQLGIRGILDFCNAPPEIFETPKTERDKHITYYPEYYDRWLQEIPALRNEMEKFYRSATDTTMYVVIQVLWPKHYKEWEKKGLDDLNFGNAALVAHQNIPRSDNGYGIYAALQTIHGNLQVYGESGIFVCAIPSTQLNTYFQQSTPRQIFRDFQEGNIVIPRKYILDWHGELLSNEREMLDRVLRTYWQVTKKQGYQVRDHHGLANMGQNPHTDPIPEFLWRGNERMNFGGGSTSARLVLEGWHRLTVVNRMIEAHKQNQKNTAIISTAA